MKALAFAVLLLAGGDWRAELQSNLARCYRNGGLSSVERDPCRFVCEDPSGHLLWKRRMSERVCRGLP